MNISHAVQGDRNEHFESISHAPFTIQKNVNIYYNNLNFRPNAGNAHAMKADSKTALKFNFRPTMLEMHM